MFLVMVGIKIAKFNSGGKWASCPTYADNAHAVGAERPEVKKLIIVYDVGLALSIATLCILLHLHVAVLGKCIESRVFGMFSQDGADVKDCLGFYILLNRLRVVLQRRDFEKSIERKKTTNRLLTQISSKLIFLCKCHIATR